MHTGPVQPTLPPPLPACWLLVVHVQVEVARLEASLRSLTKQLAEAEADYLTGSERLAALAREVSKTNTRTAHARLYSVACA